MAHFRPCLGNFKQPPAEFHGPNCDGAWSPAASVRWSPKDRSDEGAQVHGRPTSLAARSIGTHLNGYEEGNVLHMEQAFVGNGGKWLPTVAERMLLENAALGLIRRKELDRGWRATPNTACEKNLSDCLG